MQADFCMKFYTTVKQQNIHFTTKFCWNVCENDQMVLFQPKGFHCLIDVFLWQLFSDGLQLDFHIISHLRLWLVFMVLFQHGDPHVIAHWELILLSPCSWFSMIFECWGMVVVFVEKALFYHFQIYTVSHNKCHPLYLWQLCQMPSEFIVLWQKYTWRNLQQNRFLQFDTSGLYVWAVPCNINMSTRQHVCSWYRSALADMQRSSLPQTCGRQTDPTCIWQTTRSGMWCRSTSVASGWPGWRIFWPRNDLAPLLRWRRHCMAAILKNWYDLIRCYSTDYYEIWQADAK